MECPTRIALTEYLQGKLKPEELLAASEHVSSCPRCRESLKEIGDYSPAAAYVKDAALGAAICPEYEELSAYVDGTLPRSRKDFIASHTVQCDLCTTDVEAMRSMRERAELAEQIIARPARVRRGFSLALIPAWQKAAAAVALGAVLVGAAMTLKPAAPGRQQVAVNPPAHSQKQGPAHVQTLPKPEQPAAPKQNTQVAVNPKPGPEKAPATAVTTPSGVKVAVKPETGPAAPAVKPEKVEERVNLASLGVGGSLEQKLERALSQKMRSGVVTVDKPVQVALASYGVRGEGISDLAPKPVFPAVGVLRSSPALLQWKPVEQAVSYRVTVKDDAGNTVVSQTVAEPRLALSEPLVPGQTYMWQVASNFGPGGDWKPSVAVPFRVLSSEESGAVRRAERQFAGHPEVLGTVYESLGLYREAARQFEKYAASSPSGLSEKMLREVRIKLSSMK